MVDNDFLKNGNLDSEDFENIDNENFKNEDFENQKNEKTKNEKTKISKTKKLKNLKNKISNLQKTLKEEQLKFDIRFSKDCKTFFNENHEIYKSFVTRFPEYRE